MVYIEWKQQLNGMIEYLNRSCISKKITVVELNIEQLYHLLITNYAKTYSVNQTLEKYFQECLCNTCAENMKDLILLFEQTGNESTHQQISFSCKDIEQPSNNSMVYYVLLHIDRMPLIKHVGKKKIGGEKGFYAGISIKCL